MANTSTTTPSTCTACWPAAGGRTRSTRSAEPVCSTVPLGATPRDGAARGRPTPVYAIVRAGMFHSADGGDHWRTVQLEPLNAKGQIYCRDIREVPGNPRNLWVAAGAG